MADPLGRALALAAMLLAVNAGVAEDFFDYADVTAVEPLVETRGGTTDFTDCNGHRVAADNDSPDADAAGGQGIESFLDAMRRDLELASCLQREPFASRVVGYRVTYRYGGSEYVNVLDEDPGPKLRVQVRVEAGR